MYVENEMLHIMNDDDVNETSNVMKFDLKIVDESHILASIFVAFAKSIRRLTLKSIRKSFEIC